MTNETRQCQNCKKDFVVDSEDFSFYEKIHVPAPTFCPQCRFQRRLMFRNERKMYRSTCALCKESIVSVFSPDKKLIVYCSKCWWSDNWDDGAIYLDYDPNKNIFEQMMELQKMTPHMALITEYSTLVNSPYVNHAGSQKNSYMVFNSDYAENCLYSAIVVNCKDCMDIFMAGESELCYEVFSLGPVSNTFYSTDIGESTNIYFSKDMQGCNDCFGCVGLRKKSYCWFNKQLTREEYKKRLSEIDLSRHSVVQEMIRKAEELWMKYPNRYMHGHSRNVNTSGDYVWESKNAKMCYQSRRIEDSAYCQFITTEPATNMYDLTEWGMGEDMIIDCITVGGGASHVKYSSMCWNSNTMNVEYGMYNISCQNIFACINLKRKKNRILNKEYSEEEYKKIRAEIIEKMTKEPYTDSKGRAFPYGEFMPYDLSPFYYNESTAIQYFDISKEEALERGWRWYDDPPSPHKVTLQPKDIPDSLNDIDEKILDEILECTRCHKPYKIVGPEFTLLKRWGFPIPRKCPDCRHWGRLDRLNKYYFYHRQCQCAGEKSSNGVYANTSPSHASHDPDKPCLNKFETSYAPNRKEIVYCEQCYQAEVV